MPSLLRIALGQVLEAERPPSEYIDGVDLATLFETGPLPEPVAIFIMCELLSGLGYIHHPRDQDRGRVGLLHRDITPRNVLLSWEGEVKLADFGLAQMFEGTVTPHAREGTPGYMSPEQAYREALDGRSDLYAAGIVLWELLAHQRLRAGTARKGEAAIDFQAIQRPSEHRQGVPADIEAVAMRLLAYDRDARYPTAELAARDLVSCQDVSHDGRGALTRLLAERFPRAQRQDLRSLATAEDP